MEAICMEVKYWRMHRLVFLMPELFHAYVLKIYNVKKFMERDLCVTYQRANAANLRGHVQPLTPLVEAGHLAQTVIIAMDVREQPIEIIIV